MLFGERNMWCFATDTDLTIDSTMSYVIMGCRNGRGFPLQIRSVTKTSPRVKRNRVLG